MKKRIWSILLTLCMVLTLMPMTAYAVMDEDARIGSTRYATLQAAVNAVPDGETIVLLRNITLGSDARVGINYEDTRSFTLDLNGKTLYSSLSDILYHGGSGTLTIRDSAVEGKISCDRSGGTAINAEGGSINIESGTVEVIGGSDSTAVTLSAHSRLNVSGGTVQGTGGYAIYNNSDGNITISNNALIKSGITDSNQGTIYLNNGNLTINEGRVENTGGGNAIDSYVGSATITVNIPAGKSAIVKGGHKAMTLVPTLTNSDVTVAARNVDGVTDVEPYNSANINTYKYLKFEPTAPIYTISADVATFDFGSLTAGYGTAPAVQPVTITNTGNQTITLTEPSETNASSDYEISSLSALSLDAGDTATFTLQPKTGLAAGTHDETISIHGSNGSNNADTSVTAQFSVTSSGGGGGGGSSTPATVTKIESGGNVTGTNLDNLVKEGKKLTVEGKTGEKLVLDTEALKNIDGQTKDSLKVEIKDVSTTYKNEHPDRLVVSLTITAGGKHITDFGKGTATVSLPYELKEGEKAKDVTVWYLAEDGTMSEVPCTYDSATKLATFKVNHFSLYVVGTADTSAWTNPFSDVEESSWFYDAVRYVSANELMNGTSDTAFNPGAKTTRGMIVTILWRMENEPKASKEMTFADVKDGRYYHDAVAWASEKGIVGGYSAEQFGPEDNITREQLAVILHNYASFKGYKTTASGDLSVFGDSGKVHSWSKDSLSWANAKGLINGTGSNLLDPLGAAERCQVAAILQRFIENTVK